MLSGGNIRSTDRVIELSLIGGKSALSSTGLVDNRLFNGTNKLHAVQDGSGLWSLYYEKGMVEEGLKQRFTSFAKTLDYLGKYYKKRNVRVKEVID